MTFNFLPSRGALWIVGLPLGDPARRFDNDVRGEVTMTDSTVEMVADSDLPTPPSSPSVGRVFASDAQLAAVNAVAAEQVRCDRNATDYTSTRTRCDRYQKEYVEYCIVCFGETRDNFRINVDRIFNFLKYHACRPKKQQVRRNGKKRKKRTNKANAVSGPVPKFPQYFDHAAYTALFHAMEGRVAQETDLTQDIEYIGFTHLNTMKSSLVKFSPDDVKDCIRKDQRIKDLMATVKTRKGIQMRERLQEKVHNDVPLWDLIPTIQKMEQLFWDRHSESENPSLIAAALRDRWCFNDSLQCIIRAESLWKEELSDMQCCRHNQHGEPSPYEVLVRVLWDGKTNQKSTGTALLAQCFRHVDVTKCAIGSKALYLFARFLETDEEIDFANNEWFKIKTAVALGDRGNSRRRDFTKPLGSGSCREVVKIFQQQLSIVTGKALHIGRKFGSYIPQLDGVPATETCTLGNWATVEGVVFQKHCSAKVPFSAMRSCAGCGKDVGRYYLPRSSIKAPESLLKQVWPNIERAREVLMSMENHQELVTAHRFMTVMDYLREVVVQDAACMMTKHPERANHGVCKAAVFQSNEFVQCLERFRREHHHKTLPQNDPTLKHVQLVVPAIGNALENMVTHVQGNQGMLTDIGEALRLQGEKNHEERCELMQVMLVQFEGLRDRWLRPMYEDINYIAGFIRGGVDRSAGIFRNSATATGLANNYNAVTEQRAMEISPPPTNNLVESPADRRILTQPVIAPDVTEERVSVDTRLPPRADQCDSLLEMCCDWIGLVDRAMSLKTLFQTDAAWRAKHCPKSSASLKRLQRMQDICTVVDAYLDEKGIPPDDGIGTREMGDALHELEENVFNGAVPSVFAWTRHQKAFEQCERQ